MSDSPASRAKASLELPYEMSPVCRTYDGVQALVRRIDDEPAIMPDFVASSEEIAGSGRFSSQTGRGINGDNSPKIGNALRNLPMLLRQNRYECYRALHDSRTVPIEQPLEQFTHRVSLHRLRLQADRLGVKWNALVPWAFSVPEGHFIHPADLVPDSPSDWILFDKQMNENPLDVQMNVNLKDYEDVLQRSFPDNPAFFDRPEGELINKIPWLTEKQQSIEEPNNKSHGAPADGACSSPFDLKSRKLLYETALLLKEGGNQAVKEGSLNAAARRYDKAIQYCGVAFMQYHEGMTDLKHLTIGHHIEAAALKSGEQVRPSNVVAIWSPLLRVLITSRLNMSLLLLKSEFALPSRAADQARAALKLLFPFTRHEGKIIVILSRGGDKKKEHVVSDKEPAETYKEAKSLQAKAYFRLGSAELNMGDYSAAIKSFEASLKSSSVTSPDSKPDSLLMRRLQEAKQRRKAKKKRDRKKFQKLMDEGHDESSIADPDESSS
jgi:tetratricopeptide (TPR) repeat protein